MAALEKIASMHPWNQEALKSMRQALGGVNMGVVMIKQLEKSDIPNPDNIGFLSQVQLQVVESKTTPARQMNKVIDYLLEMEDKYFENFCTILEQNYFERKAKMLRERAEDLKRNFATMRPWNKEALKSMRKELGGVNMDVVMIKKLKKSDVPNSDNIGFLSQVQLQVVESERTPAGRMNKVIDYLQEMEDIYLEYFCQILEQSGFTVKAKLLREKAENLRKSVESQLVSPLEELSVSPPKTKVSSLQAEGGSDPPEREDLLADETALKKFCWIPFGIKTVSIEAKGGILCLEPLGDNMQVTKEDTIFVEVPQDAVSTSADVKMHYAIIPSGSFTLPEGYQFGSPVVYIYYDGRHVTNSLALHLPNCYGGENHARDGLSFAVAPHSFKGSNMYDFQLLSGGKFPVSSRYGVVEIGGHCSLFAVVFKVGTPVICQAVFLEKEEEHETVCDIAVTYATPGWLEILRKYRPDWKLIKSSSFKFKSDRITATLTQCRHDNSHAVFRGPSELLSCHVQYNCHGITSPELLEMAVKELSYPPSITCVVTYNDELRGTGRPTAVGLRIRGMDPEMEFQCTAYERIQVAPPPHTPGSSPTPPTHSEGAVQTGPNPAAGAVVTPLSDQPTLKDVVFFAGPYVAARWYDLGLALDVQPFVLDSVVAQQPMADQPRKMFAKWLEGSTGTGSQPRTWQTVLDAVGKVCGSAAMEDIRRAVQKPRIPTAATPKGAAPTGTNAADGQDGTTTQLKPRFAILTANDNERDAVRNYLGLDHRLSATDRDASVCSYREDAFLKVNKASVSMNEQTLSYSTFTIEFGGKKVAGVHIHCDRYGPWGAFDKTVQLLTDAKSNGWSLKTVFVVGCCGASMTKEIKEKKTWCGTVLLADEVKGYLHTGKVENAEGVNGSESQVEFLGQPVSLEMDMKWLQSLSTVAKTIYDTGFRNIEVKKTMYLSGPLVIKNQLFGDYCRGGHTIAGVEMEVIGVIKAVKAIHQYSKDECPEIVLAKGISDCTSDKAEKTKCMFFGKEKTECGDKERQVYATLQSIALVIRCVASNIQEFC